MRVGYFGDGPWARRALELLLEAEGLEVAYLVPRAGAPDLALLAQAEAAGVEVLRLEDVNAPVAREALAARGAEVMASMSFDQILRRELLAVPPRGFVNCHAGALPFYRGRSVLNWALINGESRVGVTVHLVDEGIDTGDILVQRHLDVGPEETYGELLAKAAEACAQALVEALGQLRDGTATPRPQAEIHPVGSYFGRRRPGDELLDWAWPARRILDFVRALSPPGPGARSFRPRRAWALLEARAIPGAPSYLGTPGEVVGRGADGVVVKAGDSTVEVLRVAPVLEGGGLGEARVPRFPVGSRFLDPVEQRLRELEARLARLEQARHG